MNSAARFFPPASPVLLVAALVLSAADASAGIWKMRRTVVIGDSLLAGFGSGGFVASGPTSQRYSAPAMLARQAGVLMPQPLMTRPGVPPPFHVDDQDGNGRLDAGDVRRSATFVGFRRTLKGRVRNLAVPGENMTSVFETVKADDIASGILSGDVSGRDVLKFLILGTPVTEDPVSQLTRATELKPTFLMVWIGNNEVLPMATRTNPAAARSSAAEFGRLYRLLLNRLADTGADMAVANLPDVTAIAALRHAAPEVTQCRRADSTLEPVTPDTLLPIGLDPATLPIPPCTEVLDPAEQAAVRATVQAFNGEIAAAIAEVEVDRGVTIAPIDVFTQLDAYVRDGYDVRGDGTLVLRGGYLGGIFSLDGVHPTRSGQALVANAFIDAINARFGKRIPRLDLGRVASRDPLVNDPYRPAGEPPFGLIADQDVDVGDALDDAFSDLAAHAKDVLDDLRDRVGDVFDEIL